MPSIQKYASQVGLSDRLPVAEASPQTFGSGLGGALMNVGQDMQQHFKVLQNQDREANVKEADIKFSSALRETLYNPDTGYLNQTGRNAMDGYNPTNAAIQKARKQIEDGLSDPIEKRLFGQLADQKQSGVLDNMSGHLLAQRNAYLNATSQARVDDSLSTAAQAAFHGDLASIEIARQAGRGEIIGMGERLGASAETIQHDLLANDSAIHVAVTKSMAASDPVAAKAYFEKNKDHIDGTKLLEVKNYIDTAYQPVEDEQGLQKIDAALQSPQRAGVATGGGGNYRDTTRRIESGGADNATNPRSSAAGRYQFTTGTWNQYADKLGLKPVVAGVAHSKSGAGSITDPAAQEKAFEALTNDNQAALTKALGRAPNDAELYAAHFFGSTVAGKVLTASEDTPLSSLVSQDVLKANPHLADLTAGQWVLQAKMNYGEGSSWQGKGATGTQPTDAAMRPQSPSEIAIHQASTAPLSSGLAQQGQPSLGQTLATLQAKIASGEISPESGKRLATSIRAQYSADEALRHEADQDRLHTAMTAVVAGNDPGKLPLDMQVDLGIQNMNALRDYYAHGKDTQTDFTTYYSLVRMAVNEPEKFTALNITALKDKLSPTDMVKVVGIQTDLMKDSESNDMQTMRNLQQMSDDALKLLDIEPNSKEAVPLYRFVDAKLQEFKKKNGRGPAGDEQKEIIDQAVMTVKLPDTSFFRWNPFPGATIEKKRYEITAQDIPEEDRKTVMNTLAAFGVQPTDNAIIDLYAIDVNQIPQNHLQAYTDALKNTGSPVTDETLKAMWYADGMPE